MKEQARTNKKNRKADIIDKIDKASNDFLSKMEQLEAARSKSCMDNPQYRETETGDWEQIGPNHREPSDEDV